MFAKQICSALVSLYDSGVIHCDVKPENVLLVKRNNPEIKLIDFGSACFMGKTVYSYIQSRFYRSIEIILGIQYTQAIDMWSFGCLVAELYSGLPLFPGNSEYDMIKRFLRVLGKIPGNIMDQGEKTHTYFKAGLELRIPSDFRGKYFKPTRYRKENTLEEIVFAGDCDHETKLCLLDFLKGVLQYDYKLRWTPKEAIQHPFITGKPFPRLGFCPQESRKRRYYSWVDPTRPVTPPPNAALISPAWAGEKRTSHFRRNPKKRRSHRRVQSMQLSVMDL